MKFMPIKEFREEGYLQEVNRKFFHPLGLALVTKLEDGIETIEGIHDARDNKTGLVFAKFSIEDKIKAKNVNSKYMQKMKARIKKFKFIIQPIKA